LPPTIDPVNSKEQAWIKAQLEHAERFIVEFAPENMAESLTLEKLDLAFRRWRERQVQPEASEINAVINAVGVAFGQCLVDGLGLKWVIATDEAGSDLAVYGLPGTANVIVFPANFVAKRWERGESGFLTSAYKTIERDVMRLRN